MFCITIYWFYLFKRALRCHVAEFLSTIHYLSALDETMWSTDYNRQIAYQTHKRFVFKY